MGFPSTLLLYRRKPARSRHHLPSPSIPLGASASLTLPRGGHELTRPCNCPHPPPKDVSGWRGRVTQVSFLRPGKVISKLRVGLPSMHTSTSSKQNTRRMGDFQVAGSSSGLVLPQGWARSTKRRPYGTPVLFLYRFFPALKRWANNHCAYGAGAGLTTTAPTAQARGWLRGWNRPGAHRESPSSASAPESPSSCRRE